MERRFHRPRPGLEQDRRIDAALAAGVVLWFTGFHFEERGRARGTGPTYPALAVLRRVRVGTAMLSATPGEGPKALGDVEVRARGRTSTALEASLERRAG